MVANRTVLLCVGVCGVSIIMTTLCRYAILIIMCRTPCLSLRDTYSLQLQVEEDDSRLQTPTISRSMIVFYSSFAHHHNLVEALCIKTSCNSHTPIGLPSEKLAILCSIDVVLIHEYLKGCQKSPDRHESSVVAAISFSCIAHT